MQYPRDSLNPTPRSNRYLVPATMSTAPNSTGRRSALTCSKCSECFSSSVALAKHSIQENYGSDRCCHECLKLFGSRKALGVHKRDSPAHLKALVAPTRAPAPTKIPGPTKFFTSKKPVQLSPYRCGVCGKAFQTKTALYDHSLATEHESTKMLCSMPPTFWK